MLGSVCCGGFDGCRVGREERCADGGLESLVTLHGELTGRTMD